MRAQESNDVHAGGEGVIRGRNAPPLSILCILH